MPWNRFLVTGFVLALGVLPATAQEATKQAARAVPEKDKEGEPAGRASDMLRRQVQELNKITGSEVINARYKALLEDKEGSKKLIAAAMTLIQEKKDKEPALSYNAAYILAQVCSELKDIKSSEAFFRVCMDQAARLQSTDKLLQSYGGLIDLFHENKLYAESARICRELLELKTDDDKQRIVLFAVTTRFGETDFFEAEGFDTAKRLRPAVHRLLIEAITRQGKFDQALKLVENLIKAQDHWKQRMLRGWVLEEAGKFEEAVKSYEDLLDRVGKDKDLTSEERDHYQDRFKRVLSNLHVELKQIDRAAELMQEMIKKKPQDPGLHNDLGYIWADHDQNLDQAEKLIRKALELDRERRQKAKVAAEDDHDNGAYLDSLGWVLFKQKKFGEAKDALLKAVEDPNAQHIEIYDHLGDAYLMLGEREAALRAWRKGLELAGENRREVARKAEVERKIEKHSASK